MKSWYRDKRLWWLILFVVLIVVLHFVGIRDYVNLAQIKAHRDFLQLFVQKHYIYSVALYITLYILSVALFLPVAVWLTIASGFFFGVFLGAIYSNIGATIGAAISFLIVRYLLGKTLQKKYGVQLARFNEEIEEYGTQYLLIVHFIAFFPFFVLNILAGLTRISLWKFMWTTSVGIFPGALVYTFAGRQLGEINRLRDIFSFKIFLAFILLAFLAVIPMLIKRLRAVRK
ncbi:MAG: VTT domain-containing protein [bacterium]|nr:VTT domain-containing protein [bacterium]